MVLRGERISNDPDLLDNMQVWAENNYDTRLLHHNLAFPLLKKLYDLNDPIAKKVFKEEIIKRLSINYPPIILYLINNNFLEIFNDNEWDIIFSDRRYSIVKNFITSLPLLFCYDEQLSDFIVEKINNFCYDKNTKNFIKQQIYDLFKNGSKEVFVELLCYKFFQYLNKNHILHLFKDSDSVFKLNLKYILQQEDKLNCKNLLYVLECTKDFLQYIEKNSKNLDIINFIKKKNKILSKRLESIFNVR